MPQTYVCLLSMAIHGTVSILTDATEKIMGFLNNTLQDVANDILNDISSVNSALYQARNAVNGIGGFFGSSTNIPNVSIPAVEALRNVSLPSSIDTALQKLNNSVFSFNEVNNATKNAVLTPFNDLSVRNLL
ncbi:MAG: hypothetical protein O7C62_04350 [Rickettsia endosymbiont of Ixodes persulcatus]|nr:hypothetical protein [Rickettsia endosymbiont of Ixodes persulcatus]